MITPRQAGYKMPAEWYPHAACWMAWPRHVQTWSAIGLERARIAYAKVAEAISQYEPVIMLVQPGEEAQVTEYCRDSVRIISLPLDDSWTRDTGASFLLNDQYELAGVDWIHNAWGVIILTMNWIRKLPKRSSSIRRRVILKRPWSWKEALSMLTARVLF